MYLSYLVDVGFDEWANWSPCTSTCGREAVKIRHRECLDRDACIGERELRERCQVPPCPSEFHGVIVYFTFFIIFFI